jgi:hypothetical protein
MNTHQHKHQIAITIAVMGALMLFLSCAVHATTYTATTPALADVQAKVNLCVNGDYGTNTTVTGTWETLVQTNGGFRAASGIVINWIHSL